jgi:chromosome segregation ATPase
MKMKNGLKPILILAIGMMLYMLIPFRCDNGGPPIAPSVKKMAAQEKAIQQIVSSREENLARFQQQEAALKQQLLQSKNELSKARRKNRQLLDQLAVMLQQEQPDSNGISKKKMEELDTGIVNADSLCDKVILTQEQLLVHKDSVISLQQQDFISLKTVSTQLLQQQTELAGQVSYYRNESRKLKRKNRLLGFFSAAVSVLMVQQLMSGN